MSIDLITVLGPTASGKTNIASQIARDFNGEIISADSRQVYQGMDIGTGKDLEEFHNLNIKYHLINVADPQEEYNLFRFKKDFYLAFDIIKKNKKLPILVGGTGLYLSSILQSYYLPEIDENNIDELQALNFNELKEILISLKPKLHNLTDLKEKDRLIQAILVEQSRNNIKSDFHELNSLILGINPVREDTKRRITQRLKQRLSSGMIVEIEELIRNGVTHEKLNFFGLEYKYVGQYIEGKLNYNDMFQKLNSAIHNFAKRQMTWFRKMEREGIQINWFPPDSYPEIKKFVKKQLTESNDVS
jgi:tRNA dimethylallyltransferase